MKDNLVKDALFNANPKSGASDDYARGIVVGVVSTLMAAYDWDFERALKQTVQRCPKECRIAAFPAEWRAEVNRISVYDGIALV